MKKFLIAIIMILVFGGTAIAAKSEPNSPSIKKQDANGITITAKPEPNSPSIENQYSKYEEKNAIAKEQHYKRLIASLEQNQKQLARKDLKSDEKAYIRLKMAKTYEALPSQGRLAKEMYGEILELHPEYHQNVKIAYRLAKLNDGVILDGTTPNTQQAMDCYRYVIERSRDRIRSEHGMQYETLKAYRGLGCLYFDQHKYDEARQHFEAIYHCEPGMLRIVPDEDLKHPEDIARKKAWILERLESMKSDMPQNIVNTCIHSDPEDSLKALRTLMKMYAFDTKITTIAKSVYEQEAVRRDNLIKMMEMASKEKD